MNEGYYGREPTILDTGMASFVTKEDEANEQDVAREIERAWKCTLHKFAMLSPIDFYALRDGQIKGLVEIKNRSHASTTYPNVYLNVRKWLALQMGSVGMGVQAVFVVRFTDETRFIDMRDVDASKFRMGGVVKDRAIKSRADWEPVIEVPVAKMTLLVKESRDERAVHG